MDKILEGLLLSGHPDNVKKEVLTKILDFGTREQNTQEAQAVFEMAANFILTTDSAFTEKSCKDLYIKWGRCNIGAFTEFFDIHYVRGLFEREVANPVNIVWILRESLVLLKHDPKLIAICCVIRTKIIKFVKENPDVEVVAPLCRLLREFTECIPRGEHVSMFCSLLIYAVCSFSPPKSKKVDQMSGYIRDVTFGVGGLLQYIWQSIDPSSMETCLKIIFRLISSIDSSHWDPSIALGAVVQTIPVVYINNAIKAIISDSSVKDVNLSAALRRMIDWLAWPGICNIDEWIIALFKGLASVKKYSVLIEVTEVTVIQVFDKLRFPVVRMAAIKVLSHMLLSFQHSPVPFHKIVPQMTEVVDILRNAKQQDLHCLEKLSELFHCLIYQYPGFPDLYEPVLEMIEDHPAPTVDIIRLKLQNSNWSREQKVSDIYAYASKFAKKSDTGKTGLVNLGNTCYINSVLQALYMCDSFRQNVLQATPSIKQTYLLELQRLFAYLTLSQRAAYEPKSFVKSCIPSWFTAGFQQDCSEFLKYLLDQLHEQEIERMKESTTNDLIQNGGTQKTGKTLVDSSFGGKVSTTLTCMKCRKESVITEKFIDIPLAFPDLTELGKEKKNMKKQEQKLIGGEDASGVESKLPEAKEKMPDAQKEQISLNDLLAYYLKSEKLEGENRYHCDDCQGLHDGEKTLQIIQAPDCLFLTLLRFSYDIKSHRRSKIFTDIKYPKTLQLPVKRSHSSNHKASNASVEVTNCETYALSSVIIHAGLSSDCGHYYAYSRHAKSSHQTEEKKETDFLQNKWYLFNDSRVSYSNYSSFSNVTKKFIKDTAYVLVYKKIPLVQTPDGGVQHDMSRMPSIPDPAMRRNLQETVERDNQVYLQEQEIEARSQLAKKSRMASSNIRKYPDSYDPEDKGPPGSCGGGGGMGGIDQGNKFIF